MKWIMTVRQLQVSSPRAHVQYVRWQSNRRARALSCNQWRLKPDPLQTQTASPQKLEYPLVWTSIVKGENSMGTAESSWPLKTQPLLGKNSPISLHYEIYSLVLSAYFSIAVHELIFKLNTKKKKKTHCSSLPVFLYVLSPK